MSFYVTLPSDASTGTFPNSKASNYKVKLPHQLFLHDDDWEVALSAISFPDSQAYIPHNVFGEFPMILMSEADPGRGNPPPVKGKKTKHWVRSILLEQATVPVKDGISFIKKMIQYLESEYYGSLRPDDQDWTDAEGHEGIPQFKWMKRGDQFDLLIENYREKPGSGISDFVHHNYLDINIEMAQAFGLVKSVLPADGGGGKDEAYWVRGESLQMKHTSKPKLVRPRQHGVGISVSNPWWSVMTVTPDIGSKTPFKVLRLHSFCDWIITDINDSFAKKFGAEQRTLLVYTDVAQSQIVGAGMTDFIREVEYSNKFRGRVLYEPMHLHFIPVRRNVIDVIEVQIGETNGEAVNFAGGKVILTLKFERRSHRR